MKIVRALLLLALLPACATVRGVVDPGGDRVRLWNQAHDAYAADSFRVAAALFQRVVNEHPRSHEGHESRFYLGALSLEPRSGVSLNGAEQQLSIYLAEDSLRKYRGYHGPEGKTLLALVRELRKPCGARDPGLPCTVEVVTRTEPGAPAPATSDASETVARLRREISEREATIRDLREELQRIRNTLAPRRPRD